MSDKTEPPTPKKIREAREKGQVAKSRELVGAMLFIVIMGMLLGQSDVYAKSLGRLMVVPGELYTMPFNVAVRELGSAALNTSIALLMPLLAAVIITGVAGNLIQTGFLLAFKAMKPDLNKINPGTQLKQMFSVKNLIEFAKSLVKIAVLSVVLYIVIKGGLRDLLMSATCGLSCALAVFGKMLWEVVAITGAVFVIIGAADYFIQYAQHMKELRMSKDEIKREYKEMEGDPLIKGKRKQFHQELMANDTGQRVKKASVLVTNPTHIAIGIYYDAEETPLPVVVAKGEGYLAGVMRKIAEEENIPIMQNVPLARSLNEEARLDQYIPSELIEPVAEVLRWVQGLQRN
jgi:type III secretion protein U